MSSAATADQNEGFIRKFTVLLTAPRELWLIYFGKVMETAAYGLFNMGLMLHLINDLQYTDAGAGGFVGLWATIIALFVFLVGSLSDAVGIRKTLIFAFTLCLITRVTASLVGHPVLSPILSFIPMTLGVAMTIPVIVAASRRFTNKSQRSIAFALLYVLMNVGFMIAGKLFDVVRNDWMGKDGVLRLPLIGSELSVYETIFLIAAVFTAVGLIPFVFLMRKGVEMPEEGDELIVNPDGEVTGEGGIFSYLWEVMVKTGKILAEVFTERAFYRFLLLLTLIVGLRIVFYHMHYTLPPWSDRELGYGSRFGTAWGVLNPALIIVLAPLIGALASKVSSYKMIVIGTFISAAPCFFLVLSADAFAFLLPTWFGSVTKGFLALAGDLSPLYFNLIFFAFFFSIGESIWNPRLYEYTASIAPKGREATYMGLSMLPLFLGKLGAGPMAGLLLANYCPAEGARDSGKLWLVVASMAIATPILILALKGVIKPKGRDEEGHEASKEAEA